MSDRRQIRLLYLTCTEVIVYYGIFDTQVRSLLAALARDHSGSLSVRLLSCSPRSGPVLSKPVDQEVRFAEQYIEALAGEFDPRQYADEYRDTLLAIIRAKAEGQAIQVTEPAPTPAKTGNLMEALRRSVEQVRKPPAKAEAPASRGARPGRPRCERRARMRSTSPSRSCSRSACGGRGWRRRRPTIPTSPPATRAASRRPPARRRPSPTGARSRRPPT